MTNISSRTQVNTKASSKRKAFAGLSKEAKILIKCVAVGLAFIFVLVGFQAHIASLQYENNTLANDNAYIQAEIDSLESQIVEETKVTSIEKTATEKYGMVYPTAENCITIKQDKPVANNNLASKIKKRAYN